MEDLVKALADFDIIIAMRERTWTMDFDTLNARGVPVCHTGGEKSGAATAEIALGLLLSAARSMNRADASIRKGGFQGGVPAGAVLDGKTLGIIGLGKIGARMARYGEVLGMQVVAWSENLTGEKTRAAGARLVDKTTLLAPHLGYCASEVYAQFYRESIENVLAFLDGKPNRVINPEALH